MKYKTADEWRSDAMQRDSSITEEEVLQRRQWANLHYKNESELPNADTIADHELYILGKMDLSEYETYLLFKHSPKA